MDRIFGESMALEYLIYMGVAVSCIVLSIMGIIGNYTLGFHSLSMVILTTNIIIDIVCIIYSVRTKRWRGPSTIVVNYIIFVLFPFLWFTTGGATGSTLPFIVLVALVVVIMFKGKHRMITLILVLCMYCGFIYAEKVYPTIFVPYPSRSAQYIDLILGLIQSYAATVVLTVMVLSRYNKARKETERLVLQLEAASTTDALTGIYNRRFLMTCLDEAMRSSYDDGAPLAICMIDIDLFKSINDTYGHTYGDQVLVQLAETFSVCLGENEVFGRYGGEEFLIIFKNTTGQQAFARVNHLRSALSAVQWAHEQPVTISCGIAEYTKAISYSKFIEAADTNLYIAKDSGRDCVIWVEGTTPD